MPKAISVSDSIRSARAAAGLSRSQLAEQADCSASYIQTIELGYVPVYPSFSPVFTRILKELGIDEVESS